MAGTWLEWNYVYKLRAFFLLSTSYKNKIYWWKTKRFRAFMWFCFPAYKCENWQMTFQEVMTNTPPNTFCRGPGKQRIIWRVFVHWIYSNVNHAVDCTLHITKSTWYCFLVHFKKKILRFQLKTNSWHLNWRYHFRILVHIYISFIDGHDRIGTGFKSYAHPATDCDAETFSIPSASSILPEAFTINIVKGNRGCGILFHG